jgi:hypothetical protein
MRTFPPTRLCPDPDVAAARRDARLVLRVAACALQGEGGKFDTVTLLSIAEDERMPVRTRRRAAEMLARATLAGS